MDTTNRAILEKIEQYIDNQFLNSTPDSLYEPIRYIMKLGGKRIRPLLLILGYRLFKDDIEAVLPQGYAIELFHNFSLVHDDIMDQAPLRRGLPTVHLKFGTNTGILSGDVMLIYVYQYLLKNVTTNTAEILDTFNKTAIGVCEGQQLDMDFETAENVSIEDYLQMISQKTAILLGASLKIGGLLGNAPLSDAEHLYEFGMNIGIAFQIQDDILDTFGDPAKFGKKVGGDIANNKKTLLQLLALKHANDEDVQLMKIWSTSMDEAEKIKTITAMYNKLGVQSMARVYQQKYYDQAFEHLAKVQIPDDRKNPIIQIADELFQREN
jgi:geranylgeranyl diphosphate synthase type II